MDSALAAVDVVHCTDAQIVAGDCLLGSQSVLGHIGGDQVGDGNGGIAVIVVKTQTVLCDLAESQGADFK